MLPARLQVSSAGDKIINTTITITTTTTTTTMNKRHCLMRSPAALHA
jgi:hypothetical protein